MALKLNEVAISKACCVKLDDETVAIVALMYHTAAKENKATDKSWYQYEGRVAKIADIKAEIERMSADENRLKPWHWPNPAWPKEWFMGYDNSNDNRKGARWLEMKLRKALNWEDFVALVTLGRKRLGNGEIRDYPSGAYETKGYTAQDGTSLELTDKDALLRHLNQTFSCRLTLKRDLPK